MSPSYSKLIESACRFDAVRDAARALRSFLASHGASTDYLDSWELLVVEAGNNAVENTPEESRPKGMRFLVNAWPEAVELTVTDHSRGFAWPEKADLPTDDSERGRGIYLIESLSDSVRYVRGQTENALVLRKSRPAVSVDGCKDAEMEELLESMTAELASSYESLSAIFRLTAEMSGKELTASRVRTWLGEVARIVGADWFVIRLATPGHQSLQTYAASEGPEIPPIMLGDAADHMETKSFLSREACWFGDDAPLSKSDPLSLAIGDSKRGVVHPIYAGDEAVGTLTMGQDKRKATFTSGQVSVLRTAAHVLGMRMRNTRAQREALHAKQMTRELQVAAGIQQSLFPKSLPTPAGLQLSAHSQSVREVGGDFFDAIQFGDAGVLLVIADVMGKGVPAALFAAIFRSQLRSRLDLAARPADLMSWLNKALFADLDGVDMFITAQLAYLDIHTRTLTVASAGHSPMLLVMGEDANLLEVCGEAPPIGISPTPVYRESHFTLESPARILLYTDGVTETRNSAGSLLGAKRLTEWFRGTAVQSLGADETSASLMQLMGGFQSNMPASDDVTYLILTEEPSTTSLS